MFDQKLADEILHQILNSAETVLKRFSKIKSVGDFTDSPEGMEKLDSICGCERRSNLRCLSQQDSGSRRCY